MASITWIDATGSATLSNGKPAPANRLNAWTPQRLPIGPSATGLGTGRIYHFEFRTDDIAQFLIDAIPGTDANMLMMMRLQAHLIKGGIIQLDYGSVPKGALFAYASLAPETRPEIQFSDRDNLEYSFAVTLKSVPASDLAETDPVIPSFIDDLLLWLRPESLTSLSSSANFGLWPDDSPHENDGTQSDATYYPQYFTNQINGQPSVYFWGGKNFVFDYTKLSGAGAAHGFIVMKRDEDPPANVSPSRNGFWSFTADTTDQSFVPDVDGVIKDGFGSTVRKNTVNPSADLTDPHIYEVISRAGEWTNFIDGEQLFTTATNSFGWASSGPIRLGGSWVGGANPDFDYYGFVSEFIIYSRKLSTSEQTQVRNYLSIKYGITLV